MKRIWSQCLKELSQFRRDRLTVALAFLLPLATLLIFGLAVRLETRHIPLAVQDFDHSPLSRSYIERLFATNTFEPVATPAGDPAGVIDRGQAKATVVIPPDFSRRLIQGMTAPLQVLVDGTDIANARVIKNNIQATTRFFLLAEGQSVATGSAAIGPVVTEVRLWFNPGRKESLFIVPGVYAVILTLYPSLLAAIAMVRDKEEGTIIQTYTSRLSAAELLLGKALAYWLISIAEAIFILGLGSLIWGLRLAGDPTPLLLGTPLFLLDSVMFGLMTGARFSTQSAAVQATGTVKALSAILLTGFIYPISNIPFPLSLISYIVPARYYIDLTRDAFVRGTGWPGVWYVLPMLALLGSIDFIVAWRQMRSMQLPD